MNILYLNHYAGSPEHGMEFRPFYMAKEWIAAGHSVDIIAADYSHVRAKQPSTCRKPKKEQVNNVNYTWYPTPEYKGNGLGRVKNIATFLWQVWKDKKKITSEVKPNIVIASSTYPLDIWLARLLARRSNAKLIFEVHDLWPLSPIELGGMSKYHPFIILCQIAENYAYKHADQVVSMLPKVHKHMESHGLDLRKLSIIPNGVVEADWHSEQAVENKALQECIAEQKKRGNLIVGYTGSHGKPNALNFLLKAADLLKHKDIVFILVGNGLEKSQLIKQKETNEIHNVFFFDSIPKLQIPSLLKQFDIAYIGWNKVPIYRFGISPNKLMDYMMAGAPVVHSVEAGNDPVAEANCGITVDAENVTAIADGIVKLASLPKTELETMGQRGKEYILKNQTYKVLAKKFLDVMQ